MSTKAFVILSVVLIANICLKDVTANDLSKQWQSPPPSVLENIDSKNLKSALDNAQKFKGLKSLLIVKNGYLISENYFKKTDKNDTHNVFSVSKTLIGILIGIAIKQEFIADVNDPISKYLKKLPSDWNDKKDSITIKHLLSMTSGLEWTDEDYDKLYESSDPAEYVLSKPLISKPGEKFNYDVSAYLLSSILTEATGMTADSFARENVFIPLDIRSTEWLSIGKYTAGFTDFFIKPADMAKIGQLILQNGFNGKDSLLPDQWIASLSDKQVRNGIGHSLDNMGGVTDGSYGYLCWIAWKEKLKFFWAGGFGGQRIIVVPDKNLVVVMTASTDKPVFRSWKSHFTKCDQQDQDLLDYFVKDILPIVK